MRKYFLILIVIFSYVGLLGQEKRFLSINSELFRASYEKLSEEAFNKLWDESVTQQLKITLLDQNIKIKLVLGGGLVSFEELKNIPEIKRMILAGTFPYDRVFIKHVCEVEFGYNTNIKPILEAGISLPHRVTYIESLPLREARDPISIKKKNLLFFKEYFEMMLNRFDKNILALENSILPRQLILRVGEQFSVERFLLATVGLGSEGLDMKANNPILSVKAKVQFVPFRFSKTFQHVKITAQNYGDDNNLRITITKKNINTFEFLNTTFDIDFKTRRKLFNLFRLNIGINLFRFTPTWNVYNYRHQQYLGEIADSAQFNFLKKSYLFGEKYFLTHKPDEFSYYRTYLIHGRSYFNDVNLLNIYENNHQESIENRIIIYPSQMQENVGVGSFKRYKSYFLDEKRLLVNVFNDYSFYKEPDVHKVNRSSVFVKSYTYDNHGLTQSKLWYHEFMKRILEDLSSASTKDFSFLLDNVGKERFERILTIEMNQNSFRSIFYNPSEAKDKVLKYFNTVFQPNNKDTPSNQWRKAYVQSMLLRILDRLLLMNRLLDYELKTDKHHRFSLKHLDVPGQLPIHDVLFLLIAVALGRENMSMSYQIRRMPNRTALMESPKPKITYKYSYVGKEFTESNDTLDFFY